MQPRIDGDGTVVVSKVTLVVPLLVKGGRSVLVVVRETRARMVEGQSQKKKPESIEYRPGWPHYSLDLVSGVGLARSGARGGGTLSVLRAQLATAASI